MRRSYQEHGPERQKLDVADGRVRLRWQADSADAIWHSDVCRRPSMKLRERTAPLRILRCSTTTARYIVAT